MFAAGILMGAAITLVVQGEDAVPAAEWSRARAVATRILSHAGVETVWAADSACERPSLCVRLSRSRPSTVHADAAGFAVLSPGAAYASVFLPAVEKTADGLGVDVARVLGATIAHEIGHLLLGRGHSRGVMSARFDWR